MYSCGEIEASASTVAAEARAVARARQRPPAAQACLKPSLLVLFREHGIEASALRASGEEKNAGKTYCTREYAARAATPSPVPITARSTLVELLAIQSDASARSGVNVKKARVR